MKTKSKIWLGIGAFAVVQVAGISMEAGRPTVTLAQPALAGAGTCGWEEIQGRWRYDGDCERGERYVGRRPGSYQNWERGEQWNERGGRWNERGERGNERGERWNGKGQRWEHGEQGERWGERGERG